MRWRELLRQILYFILGKGPASVTLLGLDDGKLIKSQSGAIIFGAQIEPYFTPVKVKIEVPGSDFIVLVEGSSQVRGSGSIELEVSKKTTVWVTAMKCNARRVSITVRHGWLAHKYTIEVKEHGV